MTSVHATVYVVFQEVDDTGEVIATDYPYEIATVTNVADTSLLRTTLANALDGWEKVKS